MYKKITLVIVLSLSLIGIFNFINTSYAADTDKSGLSDVINGGNDFLNSNKEKLNEKQVENIKKTSDLIYNILLVIGISVAVIVSGILGIKFMIGSVEEKAQIKDQLVPFVIGCIVVFGAFGIWKVVVSLARQL